MAITSVVCDVSVQSLVLRQGLSYKEFICNTFVHKRQRGDTMATNLGTKNCYKCISSRDNENVATYNREFSWSTNPEKTARV